MAKDFVSTESPLSLRLIRITNNVITYCSWSAVAHFTVKKWILMEVKTYFGQKFDKTHLQLTNDEWLKHSHTIIM